MTDLKDSLKQSILQEPFYSIHKLAYADLLEEEGGDGDLVLAAAYRWMAANHKHPYYREKYRKSYPPYYETALVVSPKERWGWWCRNKLTKDIIRSQEVTIHNVIPIRFVRSMAISQLGPVILPGVVCDYRSVCCESFDKAVWLLAHALCHEETGRHPENKPPVSR